MQHQSNLFWKIPNIKIRIYYQFFSNFNKHCYQNRLFLKHEPWKMTNVVLFILMNFWYFPQFLPHFAALDLLRQIFHPQICRLPRQAANMTCIVHFIKNENIFRFFVKSKKGYCLKKSVSLHEYNLFHVRIHVSDDESPKGVWKIVYVGTWYQPKNRLLTNGTPLFFIYCPNLFFGILDDLSKFRSTFGMVNFVKNHPICNMPKVTT